MHRLQWAYKVKKGCVTIKRNVTLRLEFYQKSFGDPSQVKGVIAPATISIQRHKLKWTPMAAIRDEKSWEMRTMKTQPAPYKVRQIQTVQSTLPHFPQAFSPILG